MNTQGEYVNSAKTQSHLCQTAKSRHFYQPQKATLALQDSEHPFHITLELWLRLREYLIPGLRASFPSLSLV